MFEVIYTQIALPLPHFSVRCWQGSQRFADEAAIGAWVREEAEQAHLTTIVEVRKL